jgi:3-hydroxyacyl-CoA dehydrogenase
MHLGGGLYHDGFTNIVGYRVFSETLKPYQGKSMSLVQIHRERDIAIISVNNPPVNALGQAVRQALRDAVASLAVDGTVGAIILSAEGRTFMAGADIREFGTPPQPPSLRELHDEMDRCGKPIVAALHGNVLGGGLETAMACHYRIAASGTRFGLPEVKLGILPGAGGTQRLPRLAGPQRAVDMILTGNTLGCEEALEEGIIDEITTDDVRAAAVKVARRLAALPLTRVRDRQEKVARFVPGMFDELRNGLEHSARNLIAPLLIVDCVEAACTLPFDQGLVRESIALAECMDSPQRSALVHLFFAEREAAKLPELKGTTSKAINSATVVGAGTMGGGIAMCFANAGIPVKVIDIAPDAVARGKAAIERNYKASVKRGSSSEAEIEAALSMISFETVLEAGAGADIVIEAVYEDMAIKREVMAKLDAVMAPHAILATNTSTLDIDVLADATRRPHAVIGTHFFSPANVMRLLEVVKGANTSPESIAAVMALGRRLGKVTVLAGNCDGFIVNRMQAPFGNEIDRLIEQGASPSQVDRVLRDFGFPMGPLAVRDLVGIDTGWRIRDQRRRNTPSSQPPAPMMDRLYSLGRLGQKSGKGYYRYEDRKALPDPEVDVIINEIAIEMGVERTEVSDAEIRNRALYALVNEAAKIVEDGIARSAGDVDLAYVNGYGFPAWRGGPMFWAQTIGLDKVLTIIRGYADRFGGTWQPSNLLERAAQKGSWSID